MTIFRCEECGSYEYSDLEGSGEDEFGEFTDYWCAECGALVRIYDEEIE